MPLIDTGPYTTPYLVYDAPVDEKTKKLREKFKVDEHTGYPEHYSWRQMARLGSKYKPEDPFKKFDRYNPDEDYSTRVTYALLAVVSTSVIHIGVNRYNRRAWYSKPHWWLLVTSGFAGTVNWVHDRMLERQGIKNAMILDYVKKHPERFGEIHRPKLREVLFYYQPVR